MVFVDVGANQGEFSLFAASKIKEGKVWSFEPVSSNIKMLKKNIALNNFSQIELFEFGLLDEETDLPVYTSNDEILNIDGGNSSNSSSEISGGNSEYPLSPQSSGATGGFLSNYTNIALIKSDLKRINATFIRFNDRPKVKFIKEYYSVIRKEETMDKVSLAEFFHPLQSFSEYQKQTVVIDPLTTINLDPSSFYSTEGEVSLLVVKAEYLPEADSVI
jgi:FkbM family methyltransferase